MSLAMKSATLPSDADVAKWQIFNFLVRNNYLKSKKEILFIEEEKKVPS